VDSGRVDKDELCVLLGQGDDASDGVAGRLGFSPTSEFTSVDFPTFGLPTIEMKPERVST